MRLKMRISSMFLSTPDISALTWHSNFEIVNLFTRSELQCEFTPGPFPFEKDICSYHSGPRANGPVACLHPLPTVGNSRNHSNCFQ